MSHRDVAAAKSGWHWCAHEHAGAVEEAFQFGGKMNTFTNLQRPADSSQVGRRGFRGDHIAFWMLQAVGIYRQAMRSKEQGIGKLPSNEVAESGVAPDQAAHICRTARRAIGIMHA